MSVSPAPISTPVQDRAGVLAAIWQAWFASVERNLSLFEITTDGFLVFPNSVEFGDGLSLAVNDTFIYGVTTAAANRALIGLDASDHVNIDADAIGTVFGGAVDVAGDFSVNFSTADVNSADIENTHATGFGAYFRGGGGASRPLLQVAKYDGTDMFRVNESGVLRLYAYGAGVIVSDGSGNLSSSSSITATVTGNVTGNLTGNVTGTASGNLTPNAVSGSFTAFDGILTTVVVTVVDGQITSIV